MAVTSKVHINGRNKYSVTLHGNGETLSDTIFINRSDLLPPDRALAAATITTPRIRIDRITYAIQSDDASVDGGLQGILLEFDDSTDEIIAMLPVGEGYKDFTAIGGYNMGAAPTTAAEGDVVATNIGTVNATDSFDITLECTLKGPL